VRLAASFVLGQCQTLEPEARLGQARELLLQPIAMMLDRSLDVRFGCTRTDDDLRRATRMHDCTMSAHARRATNVQLDESAFYVYSAHGKTVVVAADDNTRAGVSFDA
jgi:hypothetical protein